MLNALSSIVLLVHLLGIWGSINWLLGDVNSYFLSQLFFEWQFVQPNYLPTSLTNR